MLGCHAHSEPCRANPAPSSTIRIVISHGLACCLRRAMSKNRQFQGDRPEGVAPSRMSPILRPVRELVTGRILLPMRIEDPHRVRINPNAAALPLRACLTQGMCVPVGLCLGLIRGASTQRGLESFPDIARFQKPSTGSIVGAGFSFRFQARFRDSCASSLNGLRILGHLVA